MKRVLLVSYYFPPSGGSGVQRPLKFVKYLPECGWEATILTVEPEYAAYSDLDSTMQTDIPKNTRVIKTRARDPYAMYSRFMGRRKTESVGVGFVDSRKIGIREKIARWIRGNFFIPDARVGWVGFAERAARKELGDKSYDAILTTGPPHSSHLIGLRLRRSLDIPWVVDLRDAWPSDSYGHLIPATAFARAVDSRRRAAVFEAADMITAVSNTIAKDVVRQTETPVQIIANGFDDSDFDNISPISTEGFSVVFTGHMPDEQNPDSLWTAIKNRMEKGEWSELRVHLIGNISGEVHRSIDRHGLGSIVTFLPYVSHSEAIQRMCGASLLLLPINRVPNPNGIITGKLYEYLAAGNPILCLGPVKGDAAEIIRSIGAGKTLEHGDSDGIEAVIDHAYDRWQRGDVLTGAELDTAMRFSRRNQTQQLARLLDEISS